MQPSNVLQSKSGNTDTEAVTTQTYKVKSEGEPWPLKVPHVRSPCLTALFPWPEKN